VVAELLWMLPFIVDHEGKLTRCRIRHAVVRGPRDTERNRAAPPVATYEHVQIAAQVRAAAHSEIRVWRSAAAVDVCPAERGVIELAPGKLDPDLVVARRLSIAELVPEQKIAGGDRDERV